MTRPVNLQVFGVRNFAMKKTGDNDDNYDDSGGMLEDLESMPEPVVDFFDETYGDDLDALSDVYTRTALILCASMSVPLRNPMHART